MANPIDKAPIWNIAIPCYNRPKFVQGLLENIMDIGLHLQEGVVLSILIIDNSEDTQVFEEVKRFQDRILINYIKNPINIGAGKNVIECFNHSKRNFLHIISDKVRFKKTYLEVIYEIVNKNSRLSFLEYDIYEKDTDLGKLGNCDALDAYELNFSSLLSEKSYKLTHLSSLVFNKEFLKSDTSNIELDQSLIPQTHIFLEQASLANKVLVFNNVSFLVGGNKSVIYNILDVFYVDFLGIYKKYRKIMKFTDHLIFSARHFIWLQKVLLGVKNKKRFNFLLREEGKRVKFEFKFFLLNITSYIGVIMNYFRQKN